MPHGAVPRIQPVNPALAYEISAIFFSLPCLLGRGHPPPRQTITYPHAGQAAAKKAAEGQRLDRRAGYRPRPRLQRRFAWFHWNHGCYNLFSRAKAILLPEGPGAA